MNYRWIALGLLTFSAAVQAEVTVNFIQPDKFSDIKDNSGFRDKDVLKDIEAHIVEQAQKTLPGRDLRIDVTDVNLAGEVEPLWRSAQWLRVMRNVTLPSIEFKYEVREAGQVVKQGEVTLRDMNYQDGFSSYSGSEPLRYEKRMIDRWFRQEFKPTVASAAR
jgi:hypothetical protein